MHVWCFLSGIKACWNDFPWCCSPVWLGSLSFRFDAVMFAPARMSASLWVFAKCWASLLSFWAFVFAYSNHSATVSATDTATPRLPTLLLEMAEEWLSRMKIAMPQINSPKKELRVFVLLTVAFSGIMVFSSSTWRGETAAHNCEGSFAISWIIVFRKCTYSTTLRKKDRRESQRVLRRSDTYD